MLSSSATSDVSLQRSKFVKKKKKWSWPILQVKPVPHVLPDGKDEVVQYDVGIKGGRRWVQRGGQEIGHDRLCDLSELQGHHGKYVCEYVFMCSAPMLQLDWKFHDLFSRGGICQCRHCRRQCKFCCQWIRFLQKQRDLQYKWKYKVHFILISSLKQLTY